MKIITKYLIKNVLRYILLIAGLWAIIFSFFDLLTDLGKIGIHNYSIIDAIYINILNIPFTIYRGLVAIILIAVVLAFGNLANNAELIAMRATGKSVIHIVVIVTIFSLVVMLIVSTISELFAIDLKNKAREYKNIMLDRGDSSQNLWIKEKDYIINIKHNYDGKSFGDLLLFKIADNKLLQTISAKHGAIKNNQLILSSVKHKSFALNDLWAKSYSDYTIPLNLNQDIVSNFHIEANDLSIFDIYQHITFLQANDIQDKIFNIEFYQRLVKPFILVIAIIFAATFSFDTLRNLSMGRKLFFAVIVSLFFEFSLRISSALSAKFDYNYLLVLFIPVLLFFIVLKLLVNKSNE